MGDWLFKPKLEQRMGHAIQALGLVIEPGLIFLHMTVTWLGS